MIVLIALICLSCCLFAWNIFLRLDETEMGLQTERENIKIRCSNINVRILACTIAGSTLRNLYVEKNNNNFPSYFRAHIMRIL